MNTPLTVDIDIDEDGDVDHAYVTRAEQPIARLNLSYDFPCADWEEGESQAFDRAQVALCRKFAAVEDMEAACLTVADELEAHFAVHVVPPLNLMRHWAKRLRAALPEESEEPKS